MNMASFDKVLGLFATTRGISVKSSRHFVAAGTVPSFLRISLSLDAGRSGWPGRRSPLFLRDFLVELETGICSSWSESESS